HRGGASAGSAVVRGDPRRARSVALRWAGAPAPAASESEGAARTADLGSRSPNSGAPDGIPGFRTSELLRRGIDLPAVRGDSNVPFRVPASGDSGRGTGRSPGRMQAPARGR